MAAARRIRGARLAVAMASALALFAGLPGGAALGAQARMGLAGRNFSFLPFFAAAELGYFGQEGLTVEMIYMRSPVAVPALSSGEIQYTTHFGSVVRAAMKGFPLRVILSTSDKQLFSLVAHSRIRRVEDLKGKAVAVSNPLGSHAYVTTRVLKRFGLEPGADPKYVYLGDESAWVAAIESGLVAGAFIQPPTSIALKRKGYNILVHAGDYVELPITGLATSVDRIRKHPDEVRAMLRSTFRGIRYIKENRDGAVKLIMKFLRVDKEIAAETYDTTARYLSENGVSSEQAVRAAIESLRDPQDKRVGPDEVADFGLLKEIARQSR